MPSSPSRRGHRWNGITSHPASRCRVEWPCRILHESLFFDFDQAGSPGAEWWKDFNTAWPHFSRSLRRGPHCKRLQRCAPQWLRASAGCSPRAERHNTNNQGSNRNWMKVQWRIRVNINRLDKAQENAVAAESCYRHHQCKPFRQYKEALS